MKELLKLSVLGLLAILVCNGIKVSFKLEERSPIYSEKDDG